jgi:hypothetical protein
MRDHGSFLRHSDRKSFVFAEAPIVGGAEGIQIKKIANDRDRGKKRAIHELTRSNPSQSVFRLVRVI